MEVKFEVLDREAEQIVREIGIPPCPMILTKLMQEMRSDDPDLSKLGGLIAGDVSLAAAMLKTVNSPFYGLGNKASSVKQAIVLLGLRHVAELVTRLLLRQAFPSGTSDLMDDFWETSSAIARISVLLAREFKHVNGDALQTFGVFRDCGMLAMMQKFKNYKPVLAASTRGCDASVTAVEEIHFKVSHARVGYELAKTWLLPDGMCQAVLMHHNYAELQASGGGLSVPSLQHIALTLAAESILVEHEQGVTSAEWSLGSEFALGRMGITQAELDEIAGTILTQLATQQA